MLARTRESVASDNQRLHTTDCTPHALARRPLGRVLLPLGLGISLLLGGTLMPAAEAATKPDRKLASRSGVSMTTINRAILAAAHRYKVDAALIRAVVRAESRFENGTLSGAGAMGLMQLMPATARNLGVKDPWDPYQNIMGGTRFLRWLLDEFGSTRLALAAYNAGPNAVKRHGGVPPFKETQRYVEKVLAFRAKGG
ncbi:MAG: lytic transglycosylase domain-containing protein [Armatimonadetes bacterium]|jgi:soluble lytic murein transglycosylase-like protein|nr:lytic transglycosylase domain-containing protein [Armatimonadota bacterium]